MTDGLLLLFLVLLSKLQPSYYYVCYYCCYIHSDYHHLKYYDCYYCYSGRDRIKITIKLERLTLGILIWLLSIEIGPLSRLSVMFLLLLISSLF